MKSALTLALLLITSPLAAQDWVGTWAKELSWCAKPWGMWERPFEITREAIIMRQEYCYITKATEIGQDTSAWLVDLHCGAEGDVYDANDIWMLPDANTLWKWLGDDKPYRFVRCPQ